METVGARWVLVGQQGRLPVRVVAFRVSAADANRARQRLYAYARKKGGKPSRRAFALADWLLYGQASEASRDLSVDTGTGGLT